MARLPGFPVAPTSLTPRQAEKQETAVCHGLTETEITSSSLETGMLEAALEQNGLQLETQHPRSSLQCQLHWVSTPLGARGPEPQFQPQMLTL